MLAACSHQPATKPAVAPPALLLPPLLEIPARDPVVGLLEFAREMHDATPDERADAVAEARQRIDHSPSARSFARLAIAFGTPGQTRYTPDEAARYARRALAADESSWSPAARQYLSDFARLNDQAATATTAAKPDGSRIRSLERELLEARRKLRELANIEERLGDEPPP